MGGWQERSRWLRQLVLKTDSGFSTFMPSNPKILSGLFCVFFKSDLEFVVTRLAFKKGGYRVWRGRRRALQFSATLPNRNTWDEGLHLFDPPLWQLRCLRGIVLSNIPEQDGALRVYILPSPRNSSVRPFYNLAFIDRELTQRQVLLDSCLSDS